MGGLLPVPMKAPNTASKHALIGMAKALRDELAGVGAPITVAPSRDDHVVPSLLRLRHVAATEYASAARRIFLLMRRLTLLVLAACQSHAPAGPGAPAPAAPAPLAVPPGAIHAVQIAVAEVRARHVPFMRDAAERAGMLG